MKRSFVLSMILSFLWGSAALAWQNPCTLQDYEFIMSGDYVLMNFTDNNTDFGPRPDCGGDVTVLCPDNRECILPYGVWDDTLIIGENVYGMSFKLIDDNRLVPQNDSEWEEVLVRNGCPSLEPEPVCGPDQLDQCLNQTACEVVGGYWYDAECNQCPSCLVCEDCPVCEDCSVCEDCPVCEAAIPEETSARCPLIGNTYSFKIDAETWELSGFECTFGPGCQSECDLWHGNFKVGPKYYLSLPFVCETDGNVILTVDKMKLPCATNSRGNLECLIADISGYHCIELGGKTWCLPVKSEIFEFILEE